MNIEIKADGISSQKDVHRLVEGRAGLALHGMRDQIGLVSVVVGNDGKPSVGGKIRCLVLIRLSAHPDVVVESSDTSLDAAIHRAVDDAGWSLADSLQRQQRELLQLQAAIIDSERPWMGEQGAASREQAA